MTDRWVIENKPSIETDAIHQLPPLLFLKRNYDFVNGLLPWFSRFNLYIEHRKSMGIINSQIIKNNLDSNKSHNRIRTSWQRSKQKRAPVAASSWLSFTSKLITNTVFIRACSRLCRSIHHTGKCNIKHTLIVHKHGYMQSIKLVNQRY